MKGKNNTLLYPCLTVIRGHSDGGLRFVVFRMRGPCMHHSETRTTRSSIDRSLTFTANQWNVHAFDMPDHVRTPAWARCCIPLADIAFYPWMEGSLIDPTIHFVTGVLPPTAPSTAWKWLRKFGWSVIPKEVDNAGSEIGHWILVKCDGSEQLLKQNYEQGVESDENPGGQPLGYARLRTSLQGIAASGQKDGNWRPLRPDHRNDLASEMVDATCMDRK